MKTVPGAGLFDGRWVSGGVSWHSGDLLAAVVEEELEEQRKLLLM